MIPYIPPLALKWAAIALTIAGLCMVSYVTGRKHVRAQWDLERAKITAAAAKQEAENARTEKLWLERINEVEVLHGQKMLVTGAAAERERQRLRDSAATARLVSRVTAAAGECAPCPRAATRTELAGVGEAMVGLAERADTAGAALSSCLAAWPR